MVHVSQCRMRQLYTHIAGNQFGMKYKQKKSSTDYYGGSQINALTSCTSILNWIGNSVEGENKHEFI